MVEVRREEREAGGEAAGAIELGSSILSADPRLNGLLMALRILVAVGDLGDEAACEATGDDGSLTSSDGSSLREARPLPLLELA